VEPRRKTCTHRRASRGRWIAPISFALLCIPADANVTVQEQLELGFGLIAAAQSSGIATVTPQGNISCGPHTCMGGHQAARLRLRGNRNGVYDISYSTGDTLAHTGGGGSIPFGNFTDDTLGGVLILNQGGQGRLLVGGDLTVGPSTIGGDYTGNYTIIFNLQ
jgi:hypothetical protein